jgi:hypothetical protein
MANPGYTVYDFPDLYDLPQMDRSLMKMDDMPWINENFIEVNDQ